MGLESLRAHLQVLLVCATMSIIGLHCSGSRGDLQL